MILVFVALTVGAGLARADILYSTGFESSEGFSLGDINGQNSWVAGSGYGNIVDDSNNWILDLPTPADGWGANVYRINTESTKRYVVIEMDFKVSEDGNHFWFMDNDDDGSVMASLFWETGWSGRLAYTNSTPGIAAMTWAPDTWYHFGMEVDQQTGLVTQVNHDGVWLAEDDTGASIGTLDRFIIGQYSEGGVGHLYMDNLSITAGDDPIPEPATMSLLAVGGLALVLPRRRK